MACWVRSVYCRIPPSLVLCGVECPVSSSTQSSLHISASFEFCIYLYNYHVLHVWVCSQLQLLV